MLPNHQPLVVAEQFGMLEALHPGRIDLGIGRAPGTDQITAHALRRSFDPPRMISRCSSGNCSPLLRHPPDHRGARAGNRPAIWLLGSSDFSTRLAGELGLPFPHSPTTSCRRTPCRHSRSIVALHAVGNARGAVRDGRSGGRLRRDRRAGLRLHGPAKLSFLRLRSGRPSTLPSPEEADAYGYSPDERAFVERTSSHVVGSPAAVREGLLELQERTAADELILTTNVYDHADRIRSYELIVEAAAAA
jgi:alkanesulfonate monooxygenase SsuD/methylene tetrahydromethanopterin reductase-like flavin-dependent oxidoreductase (luciferase family)